MIEKIKQINNPLTIIAIFAALAEIAVTVSIKLVPSELLNIYIWFVMGFQALIVLLFFLTLNFNPKVLYAPSDFKNEENFVTMLGVQRISVNLEEVNQQIDTAKKQILEDVIKEIGAAGEKDRDSLKEVVNQGLAPVKSRVEKSIGTAYDVIQVKMTSADRMFGIGHLLEFLWTNRVERITFSKLLLSLPFGLSETKLRTLISTLIKEGYITVNDDEIRPTPKMREVGELIDKRKYEKRAMEVFSNP